MDDTEYIDTIRQFIFLSCRHLLSEQDRDAYSPTRGSFDRRYWGWKIADFPEATYQRNVLPLAWALKQHKNCFGLSDTILIEAIIDGIDFSLKIQHDNGSFDQAFPNEYSFGATAFLIHPLLEAFKVVRPYAPESLRVRLECSIRKAANFLCEHDELHGLISNHLAGAALSLAVCGDYFHERKFLQRAEELVGRILVNQHEEGWFVEYDGADPGYQTLCVYYLVQYNLIAHNQILKEALSNSLTFLSYFAHPDGTFGGEYGSRKTSLYYPGGIAILARYNAVASALNNKMIESMVAGKTIGMGDVDMGNYAPLLCNYLLLVDIKKTDLDTNDGYVLPCNQNRVCTYFPGAGFFVYGNAKFYTIISNSGIVKVFCQKTKKAVWNEFGYVAQLANGKLLTSQAHGTSVLLSSNPAVLKITIGFAKISTLVQSPIMTVALRLLNLSLMRNLSLNNFIKKIMVFALIRQHPDNRITLVRKVEISNDDIIVHDEINIATHVRLEKFESGRQFVAIHMASARYFPAFVSTGVKKSFDIDQVNHEHFLVNQTRLSDVVASLEN
ncbi:MAG: hypothetical protein KKH22_10460 [Proteobacteria bacterium]|nr:hypothetical protein [Pseudomonadota bacterium]